MVNDPRDLDGRRLQDALAIMGRNEDVRAELVEWLKNTELRLVHEGSLRDDIIGPIVDALYSDKDVCEKTLSDGTRFRFLFRSKIARDFLLSKPERPSHVWEPQTTRLLRHLTAETGSDVLIGGAYFGDHAILLGGQIKGTDRVVHCFEPNLDQAGMLEENAKLNDLQNIKINKSGLWHESSRHLKLEGFDSFANVVETTDGDGFKTITIDDYCSEIDRKISVILLDIEGSELSAIQGAMNTINNDKPAIVFEVHRDYVDWDSGLMNTPICMTLSDFDYQIYAIRDFNTHQEMDDLPIELIPADEVYLDGPPHGFNMVAVADPSLLDNQLFKLVKSVSPKLLRHKSPQMHHPLDGMPD